MNYREDTIFQPRQFSSATEAWLTLLSCVMSSKASANPRGKPTIELTNVSLTLDMHYPVVESPRRRMSYKFMAAEAYWILDGSGQVSEIAPYNRHISAFSDNGVTFFGAYGPKVVGQLPYIVKKLQHDSDSRQAVLTIWRENPPASKDIPCTIAIAFQIRPDRENRPRLNIHVFMRSSDIWLGSVYDWFNFTMIAAYVKAMLSACWNNPEALLLGTQTWTTASAHLYEENYDRAKLCLNEPPLNYPDNSVKMPDNLSMKDIRMILEAAKDDGNFQHPRWNLRKKVEEVHDACDETPNPRSNDAGSASIIQA